MIRRIALTLCVAMLAGAASLMEAPASNHTNGKAQGQVAVKAAKRSGYIVASS